METLSNLYDLLIETIESNINLKLDLYKKMSDSEKEQYCSTFCKFF